LVFLCHAEHLFLHWGQFRDKKALISMKNPLTYQINDKKPLKAENCAKTIEKNPPKHECARVVK
jgi:hypothetical protein